MHYHIPDNWLIEPIKSVYDLDNIKLASVEGSVVHSEFELEYLLLEGHCFEAYTGNPPRGLQLSLGTKQLENVMDTIGKSNLKLKFSPLNGDCINASLICNIPIPISSTHCKGRLLD